MSINIRNFQKSENHITSDRKTKTGKWSRAVITVEAAFLIPIAASIIALVLAFLFYTHQRVWLTAAAYESMLSESDRTKEDPAEEVRQHMENRIQEQPLTQMKAEADGSSSKKKLEITWKSGFENGYFSEWFDTQGKESVQIIDPVKTLKTAWLLKYVSKQLNS